MSRRTQLRRRGVLLLVVALLALVRSPVMAFASDTAVIVAKVRVFQTYDVSVSGLQNTFEYLIEPAEENAPLPVDSSGTSFASFTLRRNEDKWLEFPVEVKADPSATPYVYHYTMRPKQEKLSDGLYYVDVLSTSLSSGVNKYPLEIHVQPANANAAVSLVVPTVHAKEFDGPKVTDPGWRIGYKTPQGKPDTTPAEESSSESASSTRAATTGVSAAASRSSLAETAEPLTTVLLPVGFACAGLLLMALAQALRQRRGESHA